MKLTLPKFKISLLVVLRVLLFAALLFEGVIVYKYLGSSSGFAEDLLVAPEKSPRINLNVNEFTKIQNWLRQRNLYQIESYELEDEEVGRENPFAEY